MIRLAERSGHALTWIVTALARKLMCHDLGSEFMSCYILAFIIHILNTFSYNKDIERKIHQFIHSLNFTCCEQFLGQGWFFVMAEGLMRKVFFRLD